MRSRPDVTLTQLRYFVEAAQRSSMTKAAQELVVAQSAVSAAVSQLEHQIGAQLFIRQRARGLVLTPAGEELLRSARELLAHLGEILDAARGHGENVSGTIRLACFVTLAPFVLPTLLSDLDRHHPDLIVEVVETQAETVRAALRAGVAELAITYDLALEGDLDKELLTVVPPYVVLPPVHPLADRGEIDLVDLADEPMVLLDLPDSREYFLGILSRCGVEPVVRYRTSSYETVRALVARGHGYSILNQRPADGLTYDGGRVVTRPIANGAPGLPIVLARLAGLRRTARARVVAERARALFATP